MSHYTTVIKVVLVAYILMTPFIDTAPITHLTRHIVFSGIYTMFAIVIAIFYDITVAVLLMVILVIWLSIQISRKPLSHFKTTHTQHFVPPPPTPTPTPTPTNNVVAFTSSLLKQEIPFVRLEDQVNDEPSSANEYEHSVYGRIY